MCTCKSAGGSKITEQCLLVKRNGIIVCAWQREEFGKASSSIARLKKEDVRMRCGSNGETVYFYKEL